MVDTVWVFASFLLGAALGAFGWRQWRKHKVKVITKNQRVYLKLLGADTEVERFLSHIHNWPDRTPDNSQIEFRKLEGWLSERSRKIQHQIYKQEKILKPKQMEDE